MKISRLLIALPLALGVSCLGDVPVQRSRFDVAIAGSRPNVVVIVADDLAWPDVSSYGRETVSTPNLDRIARSGAAFTNGYVAAPVCSVSRAALLTGRMPQSFGFHYNLDDDENRAEGLPTGELTLADRLRDLGYRTAAIGKWHLGQTAASYPMARGFDEFYGFLSGKTLYADLDTPGIVTTRTRFDKKLKRKSGWETVTGPDATPVDNHQRYLTSDFTDRAIDFIARSAAGDAPFFLYLAYNAPHWPLQVPQAYFERFSHIDDPLRRSEVAMIAALDDGIGRVLDALEAKGLRDDTLIVFLSDNGCPSQFGFCDCSHPFGAGKFTHLEGGIRVPFLIAWPRGMKAQGLVDTPVSALDVVPTVLRAAAPDRPLPALEGQDLISAIHPPANQPPRTLLWGQSPVFAARQGPWKLWQSLDRDETQLYDLERDPGELDDVSAAHPEIARELELRLSEWRQRLPPPLWPLHRIRQAPMCVKATEWVY